MPSVEPLEGDARYCAPVDFGMTLVYVLVDTRALSQHWVPDDSLPHWPAAAAAAWWDSRLQLRGPKGERTELLFFPVTAATGLHKVHPTWAGTFVLAALGAIYPGIPFHLAGQ